jgi:hypothetical protein
MASNVSVGSSSSGEGDGGFRSFGVERLDRRSRAFGFEGVTLVASDGIVSALIGGDGGGDSGSRATSS